MKAKMFSLKFPRKLEVWLSLGGFHERGPNWKSDRRIYNSHVILNDKGSLKFSKLQYSVTGDFQCTHVHVVISFAGDIVSVYRKAHLFDVELPEKGVSLKESAFTIPGPTLVSPVQTPIGKV